MAGGWRFLPIDVEGSRLVVHEPLQGETSSKTRRILNPGFWEELLLIIPSQDFRDFFSSWTLLGVIVNEIYILQLQTIYV